MLPKEVKRDQTFESETKTKFRPQNRGQKFGLEAQARSCQRG